VPSALEAIWYRERPPPLALRLLARGFALAVQLRRSGYARGLLRSHRLARPVIVVGNLTVGGTGKTPLVIWLCEQLRRLGLAPAVVLRGYGGEAIRRSEPRLVAAEDDAAAVGDEAVLLAARSGTPVIACPDRVRAAQRAIELGAQVIVSDDGLQHLALARDVEIAVIDASRALGNGYLLPAGPLREPAGRLARLDALVLNVDGHSSGASATPFGAQPLIMRLGGDRLYPLHGTSPAVALASWCGRRVHAIAGIGNPERFFAYLRSEGLEVVPHPFPDHHRYRAPELEFAEPLPLLMTEKDAVKCRAFSGPERWFLPVEARFADADAAALMALIQARIRAA
jgi:tetraacyldisaccharide 4'-kinase